MEKLRIVGLIPMRMNWPRRVIGVCKRLLSLSASVIDTAVAFQSICYGWVQSAVELVQRSKPMQSMPAGVAGIAVVKRTGWVRVGVGLNLGIEMNEIVDVDVIVLV